MARLDTASTSSEFCLPQAAGGPPPWRTSVLSPLNIHRLLSVNIELSEPTCRAVFLAAQFSALLFLKAQGHPGHADLHLVLLVQGDIPLKCLNSQQILREGGGFRAKS